MIWERLRQLLTSPPDQPAQTTPRVTTLVDPSHFTASGDAKSSAVSPAVRPGTVSPGGESARPTVVAARVIRVSVGVGGFPLPVVGESHYQEALERLRSTVDQGQQWVVATFHIKREPDNLYDSNAIVVTTEDGDTVGYFSRSDAIRYKAAMERLHVHFDIIWCRGCLRGGTEERPSIGVFLDVMSPDELADISTDRPVRETARPQRKEHDGYVDVVGESQFKETLRRLSDLLTADGDDDRTFVVKLIPSPRASEIAVKTDEDATIGYLGRRQAAECWHVLVANPDVVTCSARLTGGTQRKPSIGVQIDYAPIRGLIGDAETT
jgi:hypothetical protein